MTTPGASKLQGDIRDGIKDIRLGQHLIQIRSLPRPGNYSVEVRKPGVSNTVYSKKILDKAELTDRAVELRKKIAKSKPFHKPLRGEFYDVNGRVNLQGACLPSIDLAESDLKGINLQDAHLRGANLRGANLIGADLSRADLISADLSGADLRGSNLKGANLNSANLDGVKLGGADLRGTSLCYSSLRGINLSGVDLSGVNLSGVNLSGANLSGANLSGADLHGADLCGANLCGASLRNADLHKAELGNANLSGANLSDVNLRGADLRGTNLMNTDLRKADLREADLGSAKLSGANLSGANLSNAKLWGTNLKGANLEGTDLRWAELSGASLSGASLRNASLWGTNLMNTDLRNTDLKEVLQKNRNLSGANLSGADLHGADLSGTNLSGANLRGANLSGVNLSEVNLRNADLSGANLTGTKLRGYGESWLPRGTERYQPVLSGANLNGASLDWEQLLSIDPDSFTCEGALLHFPQWDNDNLDVHLNHINNTADGSWLTRMDRIADRHAGLKLHMARELVRSLRDARADTSAVALPLMDVLSKSPYNQDAEINGWMDTVCEKYLQQYNRLPLPGNEGVLNQSFNLFAQKPEMMLTHNGAFIQVIALGMSASSSPAMKEKAASLYTKYLEHDQIKPYCGTSFFGDFSQKPDWEDEDAVNYILVASGQGARSGAFSTMLLSQNSLKNMLRPGPDSAWDKFYLYRGPEHCLTQDEFPAPGELFARDFPLFQDSYQYAHKKARFGLLLKALNLGSLHEAFVTATGKRTSATKLVDTDSQRSLSDIFTPKLRFAAESGRCRLSDAHYDEVIRTYGLGDAGDKDKSRTLLCLAAVFTRYSSSYIFGTHDDSPQLLRNYAYALMDKAHSLDASLLTPEVFKDWEKRLLGLDRAFACSEVLSRMMTGHINSQFPEVLADIMPPAWR
ncbi:pentapeptide repeat-containing protein [Izhakiella australiensis]|nr:pentapeptide repeat-containing protein [Izhakiella australiensis]